MVNKKGINMTKEDFLLAFEEWASKDAKWYQFWLPDSGVIGGAILGAVISAPVALVLVAVKLFCGG